MERETDFLNVAPAKIMTANPKTIAADELASAAVFKMEQHGIMALPVLDGERRMAGIVHLHDLMRAGVK
jgi:arabinose-5-phosphate isomerase